LRRERRKVDPSNHFELLGVIEISDENLLCSQAKLQLQNQFKSLRDHGDWFRPGSELMKHIREHSGVHICNRLCPDGPATEEAMRALDKRASDAINEVIAKNTGRPYVRLAGGVLYSTALARITTSALVPSSTPLGICETEQASAAIGMAMMLKRTLLRNVDQVIGNLHHFGIIVGAFAVGCST
jgi:hypothetical protein